MPRRFVAAASRKQITLTRSIVGLRRAEARHVEADVLAACEIEAEAAAGDREASRDEVRELAAAAHPSAERRVVVAAAAHLPHEAHDVSRAKRIVHVEPFAKERRHLERQPQQHPAGALRAVRGRSLEYRLEVAIVELRNDRRDHYADRNARVR